jgi:hypothetical protein
MLPCNLSSLPRTLYGPLAKAKIAYMGWDSPRDPARESPAHLSYATLMRGLCMPHQALGCEQLATKISPYR